ncbi:MAG: YidC/Oxa1 family insertase periplasmic-domain containing protein [Lentisphaeria bacterium]|nr:YidC/Oxa1 family insertase periplasmic-domain containing protein [Lentisphaeria bacterium]
MKYDKTTIIGVAVCALLLVLWWTYYGGPRNVPQQQSSQEAVQPADPTKQDDDGAGKAAPPTQPTQHETPGSQVNGESNAGETSTNTTAPHAVPRQRTPAKDLVRLSSASGLNLFELDGLRGGVVRATLEEYGEDVAPEGRSPRVKLGRDEYPFATLDPPTGWTQLGEGVHEPSDTRLTLRRIFQNDGGEQVETVEAWKMSDTDDYRLAYSATFRNRGTTELSLQDWAVQVGCVPPSITPGHSTSRRAGGAEGVTVAFVNNGKPKTFGAKKILKMDAVKQSEIANRPCEWIGVHSKYFLLWIAAVDTPFSGSTLETVTFPESSAAPADTQKNPPVKWYHAKAFLPKHALPADTSKTYTMDCYVGPKQFTRLGMLERNVVSVMNMDLFMFFHASWMGLVTRFLLNALIWLRSIFDFSWGYGVAIIVITLAVKGLFWPLSNYGTKSMRKMQKLQPQLKELRKKYKEDPQKLYRKQGELYKANNVSQLGGCLPMLIQIPVLFAMFNTFRCAIELRHAPFLWATDLSMPDTLPFEAFPIRPFAIMMGATMLLQQKLTPSGTDPQQQRMMMFMSAFFIFLFYGMPSGLTLYWTVSQVLTIVQTLIANKMDKSNDNQEVVVPA